ncbi:MAG: type II toxin-antitoxin system HicA family toxin [Thermosynechococcaceae cyanobacterium]
MGDRIRRMDAQQVEKILKKYGFQLIGQKGSHRKWRNLERNLQVVVPYHLFAPLTTIR